jgi:PBP1b-binding outer membrane lipoprotein LpoB
MKKLLLSSLLFGSLVLSACSSGVNDVKPVESKNIKEVCLKGSIRKAPDEIVDALTKSLKQKHIKARLVKKDEDCNHILHFSVKGNSKIIARARLDLRDSNKLSLGSVTYKHRS